MGYNHFGSSLLGFPPFSPFMSSTLLSFECNIANLFFPSKNSCQKMYFRKSCKCLHTLNTDTCSFLKSKLILWYTSQSLVTYWIFLVKTRHSGFVVIVLLLNFSYVNVLIYTWGPHLISIFICGLRINTSTESLMSDINKIFLLAFLNPQSWASYPHVTIPSFKSGEANVVPLWFMVSMFLKKTGEMLGYCL